MRSVIAAASRSRRSMTTASSGSLSMASWVMRSVIVDNLDLVTERRGFLI